MTQKIDHLLKSIDSIQKKESSFKKEELDFDFEEKLSKDKRIQFMHEEVKNIGDIRYNRNFIAFFARIFFKKNYSKVDEFVKFLKSNLEKLKESGGKSAIFYVVKKNCLKAISILVDEKLKASDKDAIKIDCFEEEFSPFEESKSPENDEKADSDESSIENSEDTNNSGENDNCKKGKKQNYVPKTIQVHDDFTSGNKTKSTKSNVKNDSPISLILNVLLVNIGQEKPENIQQADSDEDN
ncbi:hypothetical protein EDEG_02265 [Edhazardia aedis USNM 41457]|uniref:Uncharacterized protein n=1 Tax=Edhazardia aedis (strain USNM 41457) TaxID=1003232 RepID=J8ZUP6_EDHAE|nr:hypothetical protein EDEG_02265 [Edhazardia aedis USNM 41457]|eukprot:EJW03408.1 hypothetical protein EDEG_02265 [Edhazardia aedis USNM 41457]